MEKERKVMGGTYGKKHIDSKGRIGIPKSFSDYLSSLEITNLKSILDSFENSTVYLFTNEAANLAGLTFFNKDLITSRSNDIDQVDQNISQLKILWGTNTENALDYNRTFYQCFYPSHIDSQNRIVIPQALRENYEFGEDTSLVLVGAGDCFHLMDETNYQQYQETLEGFINSYSENLTFQ